MKPAVQSLVEYLIAQAETIANTPREVTRGDGSKYMGAPGYGSFREGRFEVYVISVEQRTRIMKPHYRATFYLDGKRVSRGVFHAAVLNGGQR